MKKLTLLITALLLLVAMTASAQVPKPITIYAEAGLSMPNGDLNASHKAGIHIGVGAGFNVAPNFQIVPNIEYHSFGFDLSGLTGGKLSVIMFGANGRMSLGAGPMPAKPYLLGGLGMARGSIEAIKLLATEISSDESSTDFYWNIGAGVQITSFFIQARYVSINTADGATKYIPVTVGFKF